MSSGEFKRAIQGPFSVQGPSSMLIFYSGHLLASLVKLMLFGFGDLVRWNHVYSASKETKLHCFERIGKRCASVACVLVRPSLDVELLSASILILAIADDATLAGSSTICDRFAVSDPIASSWRSGTDRRRRKRPPRCGGLLLKWPLSHPLASQHRCIGKPHPCQEARGYRISRKYR